MNLQSVIDFAVKAHEGQVRKHSGLPYICHPMAVMSQLADWNVTDEITWHVALCHDVLEECPHITVEQLATVIGGEAADVVQELTFIVDPSWPSWVRLEQKKAYLKSFEDKSLRALVVKVADRIVNTRDFHQVDYDYARKYWNYASCLFSTMRARQIQIGEFFGPPVFPRIMHTRMAINGITT